jgi:dUTP pyrophosphatase
MNVKVKKLHKNAVIPKYAHASDAGLDLTCVEMCTDEKGNLVYDTGLAFEIPYGYVGLLFPRSSVCKKDLALTNCVGVIDSGYRGPVKMKFRVNPVETAFLYGVGDRIGQLIIMPYPKVQLQEVEELGSSDRGVGGYGSTGN